MMNFCDSHSGYDDFFFQVHNDSVETRSSLGEFHLKNKDRLRDGKITYWITDNGTEFQGNNIDGPDGVVRYLVGKHEFSVPNVSNTNPRPERSWGVAQRSINTALAFADDAPECLWPWVVAQHHKVSVHMASRRHEPPASPHSILYPSQPPADLAWARVLFCNVTVAIPDADRHSKLGNRAADGCHLGYDDVRRCHYVYVPSLQRIGSFRVIDWCGEDKFTTCKQITADTPVEYHQPGDLQFGPATASLLPHLMRKERPRPLAPGALPAAMPPAAPPLPVPPPPPPPPAPVAASLAQEGANARAVVISPVGTGSVAEREQRASDFIADRKRQLSSNESLVDKTMRAYENSFGLYVDKGNKTKIVTHPKSGEYVVRAGDDIVWVCDVRTVRKLEKMSKVQASGVAIEKLPTTIEEAKRSKYWPMVKDGMESEIKGKFVDNNAWDVVKRPDGVNVVKSRWVIKFTINDDGSVKSVKCRLVACGYSQREGVDYFEVYAKTPAGPNIRLFAATVAD